MHFFNKSICALFASLIVIAGCSGNNSDTYLRFRIEGQHHELDQVILGLMSLPKEGWQFLDLGQDITKINTITTVPTASIQWRMKLKDPAALEGQVIDLDEVNDPDMATPTAMFRLTDDISAFNSVGSSITVTITTVSEGFVEGTFEGSGLIYFSDSKGTSKNVNVSGSYRAKIER